MRKLLASLATILSITACAPVHDAPLEEAGPNNESKSEQPGDTTQITFEQITNEFFKPHCLSCHNSEKSRGGIDLSSFEKIKSSQLFVPGNPDMSFLYKIVASGEMPPRSPISPEKIELLGLWIEQL